MRYALATIALCAAGGSATAQYPSQEEITLNTLASAMVAGTHCNYRIDRDQLERALNFNGLYSGDIVKGGRFYARLQFHYSSIMDQLKSNPNASCENLRRHLTMPNSIWRNVIIQAK